MLDRRRRATSIQHWAVNHAGWVSRVSTMYRVHVIYPPNAGLMLGQHCRRWPYIGQVHGRSSDRTASTSP